MSKKIGLNISKQPFNQVDEKMAKEIEKWMQQSTYAKNRLENVVNNNLFSLFKKAQGYAYYCDQDLIGIVVVNKTTMSDHPKDVQILKICACPTDNMPLLEYEMLADLMDTFQKEGYANMVQQYPAQNKSLTHTYRELGFAIKHDTLNQFVAVNYKFNNKEREQ